MGAAPGVGTQPNAFPTSVGDGEWVDRLTSTKPPRTFIAMAISADDSTAGPNQGKAMSCA